MNCERDFCVVKGGTTMCEEEREQLPQDMACFISSALEICSSIFSSALQSALYQVSGYTIGRYHSTRARFQDRLPMFWKYSAGVHAIEGVSEVVAESACDVYSVTGVLYFWLWQVSMVLPTVAVFAWPPSVLLCTPSPPVDAPGRK